MQKPTEIVNKEGNIYDLCEYVFRRENELPIASVNAIPEDAFESESEIFEFLLTFFTTGMKIAHGDSRGKVNLGDLSAQDIETFKKKFQAVGFDFVAHRFHESQMQRMYQNQIKSSVLQVGISGIPNANDENLFVDPFKYPKDPTPDLFVNYKSVYSPDLKDYKFQIKCEKDVFVIYFEKLNIDQRQ